MLTHNLGGIACTFVEARLAAIYEVVKSAPKVAQRGMVRAESLSPALFDLAAA